MIGMSVAAGCAAALYQLIGEPQTIPARLTVMGVMIAAGCLEGMAIGFFQWRVLRQIFHQLSAPAWLLPTVAVAAIGWFFGMLQPTFFAGNDGAANSRAEAAEPSALIILLFAAALGIVAGALFGLAQWLVLRKHRAHAWIWIPANAIGWAAALAIIFFGATLPDAGWPLWQIIPLGAATGVVAGLAIGAISGWGLLRILFRDGFTR